MNKQLSLQLCTFAGALCLALPSHSNDSQSVEFSTGIDFSSGDYGDTSDTKILYLPVSVAYRSGAWKTKLTVPWVQIEGPGGVVGAGDGGIVVGGSGASAVTKESGIGDTWLSVTRSLASVPAEVGFVDLVAKVKFPTANEKKGLGTGETDYTLQADFFKSMGQWTPMASVAYKIKGDPSGTKIDDVWYLSGGADFKYSETINVGATLDHQQASTRDADDSLELFGYVGVRTAPQWSVMGYSYFGLSEGSPDYGVGFQIKHRM